MHKLQRSDQNVSLLTTSPFFSYLYPRIRHQRWFNCSSYLGIRSIMYCLHLKQLKLLQKSDSKLRIFTSGQKLLPVLLTFLNYADFFYYFFILLFIKLNAFQLLFLVFNYIYLTVNNPIIGIRTDSELGPHMIYVINLLLAAHEVQACLMCIPTLRTSAKMRR